jgi:hypothetical protein
MVLAIIFQFAEIIPALAGKKVSGKAIKAANTFTIAECVCAILMFVAFWLCVFFGFYPMPYLIIMPFALVCQIMFVRQLKM